MKDYFKKLKNEYKFYSTPTNILKSEYFTSDDKLLLIVMVADLEMNGRVKWCQQTYADKTGLHRDFVGKRFRLWSEMNLLKPSENNKRGSKYNEYGFNTHMFELMLKKPKPASRSRKKKKTCSSEPQTCSSETQTCSSEPINMQSPATYIENTDSTESTYLYKEQGDDSLSSSPVQREMSDEEMVLNLELDI